MRKAAPHPLSHGSLVSAPEMSMSMGINSTANAAAVTSAVERKNRSARGNVNTDLNNMKVSEY